MVPEDAVPVELTRVPLVPDGGRSAGTPTPGTLMTVPPDPEPPDPEPLEPLVPPDAMARVVRVGVSNHRNINVF